MSAIAGIAASLISPALSLLGVGQKKLPAPVATPTPQRDVASQIVAQQDLQAKRRGAAANLLLGAGGAESSTGNKTTLGS